MLTIAINSLLALHVLVSLLIVLVVLMQRPKNEGLGAAFGGGMTDNLFGAQTTNVLQKFTRLLGGTFFFAHCSTPFHPFSRNRRASPRRPISSANCAAWSAPALVLPKVLPNASTGFPWRFP